MRIIKVHNLDFTYRDDILFMFYCLITNNRQTYKKFSKLKGNRKLDRRKLRHMRKSIIKHGQKMHVNTVKIKNHIYPANGAHRISSLLSLGHGIKIKIKIRNPKNFPKWEEKRTLDTHHLRDLPEEILTEFKKFKDAYLESKKNNSLKEFLSKF